MEMPRHIKGTVKEVGENGTAKVLLPEYDGLVTGWLPVMQPLTLGARAWAVPREGSQVIVLPGRGIEDAVVLGAIYSKPDPAPFEDSMIIGLEADDGVTFAYDPESSTLSIRAPKEINIVADCINIDADCNIKGNTTHQGDAAHQGNMTHQGDTAQTGNLSQTGATTTLAATIGGIPFLTHKHPGVVSGPAVSAPPIP